MGVIITGMEVPRICAECDFCKGHICKRTKIDIVANPKKDCPIKSLKDIRAEIEAEMELAIDDFKKYKVECLGVNEAEAELSLPDDEFAEGLQRCLNIINRYL